MRVLTATPQSASVKSDSESSSELLLSFSIGSTQHGNNTSKYSSNEYKKKQIINTQNAISNI
jgi:hypothetical protein